ncbi:class I adenylate-forming enzyme family protein [Phenylobacterium deserti]|uniref:Long-chain fatty acid--CoA ligase n=1 Tax=Phenylobacterium deserti TaxID=1914756 RepID=A0A328ACM2_9CAUL|nr:class I adenylate-forming enzyme family protein [Phenylobacterium deserti]RAK52390.1 hypothetical protein DJ018_14780 [Phenylobacterium deserti]
MAAALWRMFEATVERRGGEPAIVQGDRSVSFSELHLWAARYGAELRRHGLQPGERCLIWSGNSPELAAAILGVWMCGGILALVNDEAPLSHLRHAANVTEPRLILADEAHAHAAAETVDEVPVISLGPARGEPLEGLGRLGVHDHEPASIFFTSGSTGAPKGVTQSHANLAAGCLGVAHHLGLRGEDRILCPIPWSFDYGYGQLLSTVLLGVTQVLPTARNSFALCEAIEAHRPTILAGLPSIFALLLRGVSPLRQTDVSSIRLVTNTGGLIAPAIFADVLKVFDHCDLSLNYGMTETYRSAGLPVELARERPESVGFAYPGVSLDVLRENGETAEPGEIGEIVHRGVGAFLGYWGQEEATARVRRPDPRWNYGGLAPPPAVFTGDLGWKDEDGFLMIKGRRDRLIKSMGVRVSPDEVETAIRQAQLVRDVAVVGVPHELMGEMVAAAVIAAEDGPDPVPELKAFARRELSPHMQPREYRVIEAFPLTPNGKPDFAAVRAMFQGRAT